MAKVEVKITARDQARFKKDVKEFLKSKDVAVDRALDATALQIRSDAVTNLDQHKTTDRGILKNSITVTNTSTSTEKTRKVGTETGYGKWVELGRPPGGYPPIDLIKGWVRRKLKVTDDKKAKGIAFVISRAIAKRGTKAQPFLRPAYLKNKRTLAKALKRTFRQL